MGEGNNLIPLTNIRKTLSISKNDRAADQFCRMILNLRFIEFRYVGKKDKTPKAIYEDAQGVQYMKHGLCSYEVVSN